MSSSKLLTIAIPTYNRTEFLIKNIDYLLNQLTEECKVLIIDNASDIPVENKLKKKLGTVRYGSVSIIRNNHNVGLFGNILKCFEHCNTQWLYIMGDDDRLRPNALAQILIDIKENKEYLNISYKWDPEKKWSINRPKVTNGFQEFVTSVEGIHQIMFLSCNIYNNFKLIEFIHSGYYYQMCGAPHLAMVLIRLDNYGDKILLSENKIVENFNLEIDEELKWNKPVFFRNIKLFNDLPIKNDNRQALFDLYAKTYPIKKYLRFYLLRKIDHQDTDALPEFKKATLYYNIYGSFMQKIYCKMSVLAFPFSSIINKFVKRK